MFDEDKKTKKVIVSCEMCIIVIDKTSRVFRGQPFDNHLIIFAFFQLP